MPERIQPPGVFEPVKGLYAQIVATRPGTRYEIAGTLPYTSEGMLPDGLPAQARETMENIGRSLGAVGLTPAHVVRITIYTRDMDAFLAEALEIVFGWFGPTRPASTLVEVSRLPKVLVEISAVAVDDDAPSGRS
jgi:enamine deaminase RidA (YjgF/YER057c/UK114 family)